VLEALLSPPIDLRDAPARAPYYRIAFTSTGHLGGRSSLVYVPARRMVLARPLIVDTSGGLTWRTLAPRAERMLQRLTRGVRPYRAPRSWRGVAFALTTLKR
jgi:hypothetical protein